MQGTGRLASYLAETQRQEIREGQFGYSTQFTVLNSLHKVENSLQRLKRERKRIWDFIPQERKVTEGFTAGKEDVCPPSFPI